MLNILIPMAGAGKRFEEKGYTDPKPFIPVHGRPMISHVISNIGIPGARYIFIAQQKHLEQYGARFVTEVINKSHVKDFVVVPVEKLTEGAACTALLAEPLINTDDELLIANSDQLVGPGAISRAVLQFETWNSSGILCFPNKNSKWSYAELDTKSHITRVAEKDPISDIATCGIYYWRHGRDYCSSAHKMISANDRVNGEFYIAPTFNYLIKEGEVVRPYMVDGMTGLGTPEDLEAFLGNRS